MLVGAFQAPQPATLASYTILTFLGLQHLVVGKGENS